MAKSENQKSKLLYLYKMFTEQTDDDHGMTIAQIIDYLEEQGIKAQRKTLYDDIALLTDFGLDIIKETEGKQTYYHLASRTFELAELKLLVDSVQAAKFVSEKKSRELISKLETLASRYEARQLQRQVVITGRVKTANEQVYYNVDVLHNAINRERKIRFQYFNWDLNKEMKPRRDGAQYLMSPWALLWDDEYYYLVAYDSEEEKLKHFRVDKMMRITILEDRREGKDVFNAVDPATYSKRLFGMFSGETMKVTIEGTEDMAGIFIDRFGKDIYMAPKKDGRFETVVEVNLSRQFIGWIISLGENVRLTGPKKALDMMKEETERLAKEYLK